jgi:hypothetical protein
MEPNDESSFFDKLGEILNAPLPGTARKETGSAKTVDEEDDDSMLERVKDILQHTLPGAVAAEQESAGTAPPAGKTTTGAAEAPVTDAAAATDEPAPDPDTMEENWWDREWDAFRSHQDRERNGFNLKQRRDQETFARYQEQEKMRFDTHQKQEFEGFRRQQQWKLDGWKQRIEQQAAGQVPAPGRMPPPSPWAAIPPGPYPGGFPPLPGVRPPHPRGRRR